MDLLILDFLILAVLMVSSVLSLIRGFTREILSITGWVVSGYAAILFAPSVKPHLAPYVSIDWVVTIGAILIVFLVVLVVFSVTANAFADRIKFGPINTLDRSLGALFGLGRGLFIVSLGYFVATLVVPERQHPDWLADAKLRPLLQTTTEVMVSIVPVDRLNPNDMEKLIEKVQTNDALREAVDGELKTLQDKLPTKGYKESERNLMERLIRNTDRDK